MLFAIRFTRCLNYMPFQIWFCMLYQLMTGISLLEKPMFLGRLSIQGSNKNLRWYDITTNNYL